MSDETSHTKQGQIERAKRLREQVERLKSGKQPEDEEGGSLREQIERRAAETKKGLKK